MRLVRLLTFGTFLGLFAAVHAFAQTSPEQQRPVQDGNNAAMKSGAEKQSTQGSLPMVGPASRAYKQNTQSPADSNPSQGSAK